MKKPFTFWEYLFYRSGNVIETKDGRCYVINKPAWYMLCQIAYIILCLPVLICPLYYVFGSYWPNVIFDYLFMLMAIPFVISVIRYRNAPFAPADHCTADRNKPNRCVKLAAACFVLLVSLFFLLNGVGVSSLRSLIDGGGRLQSLYVSHKHSNDEWHFTCIYNDDGTGRITTEPLPADVRFHRHGIEINVMHTPATANFLLNGKPPWGDVECDMESFWFWENDYLLTNYYFESKYGAIRDGSTLTLTCGDLYREWVFEVDEEEGI